MHPADLFRVERRQARFDQPVPQTTPSMGRQDAHMVKVTAPAIVPANGDTDDLGPHANELATADVACQEPFQPRSDSTPRDCSGLVTCQSRNAVWISTSSTGRTVVIGEFPGPEAVCVGG